jgi:UDP:flavonoid glycosyltransferase YjiC (YdhE family)
VVVAASTEQDQELRLVRVALESLADEPVRVLASMNRRGREWAEPVPDNAVVVDWVSYAQVMPHASLVVCTGGHGTVARVLAEGLPLLVWAAGADTAENGARATWAGAGLMLPRRLLRPGPLRWAVRRLLAEPNFAERAREIAAWSRRNNGTAQGAELVEAYARR